MKTINTWFCMGLFLFVLFSLGAFLVPPDMTGGALPAAPPSVPLNPFYSLGLVVGLLALSLVGYLVPRPHVGSRRPDTRGGAIGVLGFLAWFGAAVASGLFVIGATVRMIGTPSHQLWIGNLAIQGTFLIAGAGFLWLYRPSNGFEDPDRPLWFRAILRGGVTYARLIPALVVAAWLNVWILEWVPVEPSVPQSVHLLAGASSVLDWVVLTVLIVILAPLCEELFFRGILFNLLREWASPLPSALLSALVFSSIHRELAWFLPVLVLGYVLAMEYERTGSLKVPMVIHALQNALGLSILYVFLG